MKTREVKIGGVTIGGGNKIAIQSMTNTKTEDAAKTIAQIRRLEDAGCDIVRVAVRSEEAAKNLRTIRDETAIPVVSDIHFDNRLALLSIKNGADKIRINPGNLGGREKCLEVAMAAKEAGIPIRIGINSGSLERDLLEKYGRPTPEALAESAMRNVRMFENEFGFGNLVLSIKSKDVRENFLAHKAFGEMWRGDAAPPIHVGITEAGVGEAALIKSAVGIGSLLLDGLGDTIRVSLTGDPIREIEAAKNLLAALGLRKGAINIISCPTCGRCEVNLEEIALRLKSDLSEIEKAREVAGKRPLDVAVMGCPVNGPGEAKDADIGIAFSSSKAILFSGGEKNNAVFEDAREAIKKVVEFCERAD